MRFVLAALMLTCSISFAETYKLEASLQEGDSVRTGVGNCFPVSKRRVMTCWHVVEDRPDLHILFKGKKVRAKVIKKDTKQDLALLEVKEDLFTPLELFCPKLITLGSEKDLQIKEHSAKATLGVLKSSYNVGISGSPVMIDGKVLGMIICIDSFENPTESKYVAAEAIKEFLSE